MGYITISELKPDMVLASDLRDQSGRLLIGKGTKLTPKYIKICKMWGVIEADIVGISQEEIAAAVMGKFDPATIAAAEQKVAARFIDTDMEHPAVRELFRLCTLRCAMRNICEPPPLGDRLMDDEAIPDPGDIPPAPINLESLISEDTQLSTLPDIYTQINDIISRPQSSAHEIADVVGKDTNLSARLLKIVNSAFYGYPAKIDTLSRAVNIVGTKQISLLAIGINLVTLFKRIPATVIDMKSFWQHSILCGINARIIAGYKNIQNTERLFVAGLLHDIGRLLMYNHVPEKCLDVIASARKRRELLYRIEKEVFEYDHAGIGGLLLAKWKLPVSLENTVRSHHNPMASQNRLEASIVHLADIIANAMSIGSSGEVFVPRVDIEAWNKLGLSSSVLSLTMEQSDQQLSDIFSFFFAHENQTAR
jgi:putative nucleotidyltransferase with HDIG domain